MKPRNLRRIAWVAALFLLIPAGRLSAQPGKPSPVSMDDTSYLEYYLPFKNVKYDPGILTPEAFFGFELKERMVDWGDVTRYVDYLAGKSDRVSVRKYGYTAEKRRFLQVCITSPENQRRLEEIRQEHLKILDPAVSPGLDLDRMPLVVDLRGSVHGNEISGVQGLIPVMYHYAAADDPAVASLLEKTVILFVPGQNPDGISRFATWVNSNASANHFLDRQAREYHEVSPSSRANHYWMDSNRDWLTAQYPEGRNSVTMYEYWMPNVLLDLHEQSGSRNGLYYYSPGDPNRTYRYIPQRNQDLTRAIGKSTGRCLDSLGVSNFTERGYDDYFIGKGACYGDLQGSVCILHEVTSTRGHLQRLGDDGFFTFGETVRWQSMSAVAVLKGAVENAKALKEYQRDFYIDSARKAAADKERGYVFDARGNRGIAFNFLSNLLLHEIDVYPVNGEKGRYFVPFRQRHYYKVKGIFEDITEFQDSIFYDISTWSPARAYNLNYGTVTADPSVGRRIAEAELPKGKISGGRGDLGYAFAPGEFYTPYLITALQKAGVCVQVSPVSFRYWNKADKTDLVLPAGTLVIPAAGQPLEGESLRQLMEDLARQCSVDVLALKSQKRKGFSLSALTLKEVRNPRTAIITDTGNSIQQGAMWHMLDCHFAMNHSLVDFKRVHGDSFDPERYDAMIFSGNVNASEVGEKAYGKLASWVEAGGTLILFGGAHHLASGIGNDDVTAETGKGISGLVLNAEVTAKDSPLLWGYDQESIDLFQGNATVWNVDDRANVVLRIAPEPYRSGYVSEKNLKRMAGSPVIATRRMGKGCIIYIKNDLTYRSYWYGTNHILTNALLFGNLIP